MKIMKTQGSLLEGVQMEPFTVLSWGLVSIARRSPTLGFVQFVSHRLNCHIVKCIFVYKTFMALGAELHLEAEAFQVDRVSLVLFQRGSAPCVCPVQAATLPACSLARKQQN